MGGGVSGEGAAVEAGARRRERRRGPKLDIARKRILQQNSLTRHRVRDWHYKGQEFKHRNSGKEFYQKTPSHDTGHRTGHGKRILQQNSLAQHWERILQQKAVEQGSAAAGGRDFPNLVPISGPTLIRQHGRIRSVFERGVIRVGTGQSPTLLLYRGRKKRNVPSFLGTRGSTHIIWRTVELCTEFSQNLAHTVCHLESWDTYTTK